MKDPVKTTDPVKNPYRDASTVWAVFGPGPAGRVQYRVTDVFVLASEEIVHAARTPHNDAHLLIDPEGNAYNVLGDEPIAHAGTREEVVG